MDSKEYSRAPPLLANIDVTITGRVLVSIPSITSAAISEKFSFVLRIVASLP